MYKKRRCAYAPGQDEVLNKVQEKGFDINALEIEEQIKILSNLAKNFKDAHAEQIAKVNEFEKRKSEKLSQLENELVSEFGGDLPTEFKNSIKDWKKVGVSKYDKISKAVLENAAKTGMVGDKLKVLVDDLEIVVSESEKDSYKMKYEMLVSCLAQNGEYEKYSSILDISCNKIFYNLETGLKALDKKTDDWKKDVKDLAIERKLDWKSLLKYTFFKGLRRQEKTSSVNDIVKEIKGLFSGAIQWFGRTLGLIYSSVIKETNKVDEMEKTIKKLISQIERVI